MGFLQILLLGGALIAFLVMVRFMWRAAERESVRGVLWWWACLAPAALVVGVWALDPSLFHPRTGHHLIAGVTLFTFVWSLAAFAGGLVGLFAPALRGMAAPADILEDIEEGEDSDWRNQWQTEWKDGWKDDWKYL